MTTTTRFRATIGALVPCLALLGSAALAQEPGGTAGVPQEWEAIRTALEKYQDPVLAVHDGYFSTVACVMFPKPGGEGRVPYRPGGMGVHFLNLSAIGPELDPSKPQVLIYEPDGGKLRLVAVEWFVPLATGIQERPTLMGRPFDGPMEGHHPLQPVELHHYDLHVWLYKPNPTGMFSPTNPDISCSDADYVLEEEAPPLVEHRVTP